MSGRGLETWPSWLRWLLAVVVAALMIAAIYLSQRYSVSNAELREARQLTNGFILLRGAGFLVLLIGGLWLLRWARKIK